MHVYFRTWLRQAAGALQVPVVHVKAPTAAATAEAPGTRIALSDEAKRLAEAVAAEAESEKPESVAELKSYIKGLDFSSISLVELDILAIKLVKAGQLSPDKSIAFRPIATNTEPPRDPAQKVNLDEHFDMMLRGIKSAAKTDASLRIAVSFRKESIETLNAIRAFADSDRTKMSDVINDCRK